MRITTEDDHLVRPSSPLGQFVERAAPRARRKLGFGNTARIHAGAAHADRRAVLRDAVEHKLDVVEAFRHLLAGLRAGRRVPDEKYAHFVAFPPGKNTGEAQTVVTAFGTVRRIVEDEQCLAHFGQAPIEFRERALRQFRTSAAGAKRKPVSPSAMRAKGSGANRMFTMMFRSLDLFPRSQERLRQ